MKKNLKIKLVIQRLQLYRHNQTTAAEQKRGPGWCLETTMCSDLTAINFGCAQ